jgi:hypothetical protein
MASLPCYHTTSPWWYLTIDQLVSSSASIWWVFHFHNTTSHRMPPNNSIRAIPFCSGTGVHNHGFDRLSVSIPECVHQEESAMSVHTWRHFPGYRYMYQGGIRTWHGGTTLWSQIHREVIRIQNGHVMGGRLDDLGLYDENINSVINGIDTSNTSLWSCSMFKLSVA